MVEMIPNAETLRKIQVEHGVTGSFKDRPLADWLQKHNPGEDEYEKVGLGVGSASGVRVPDASTQLFNHKTRTCSEKTAQLCWQKDLPFLRWLVPPNS